VPNDIRRRNCHLRLHGIASQDAFVVIGTPAVPGNLPEG